MKMQTITIPLPGLTVPPRVLVSLYTVFLNVWYLFTSDLGYFCAQTMTQTL